jgi:uncharacterized coiled-coil protein SlyX
MINEKELNDRISNQAKKLTELQKLLKARKESLENLQDALRRKTILLTSNYEESHFLKDRIEKIYGKRAYYDLLNCVENPNQFNAQAYWDKHFSQGEKK